MRKILPFEKKEKGGCYSVISFGASRIGAKKHNLNFEVVFLVLKKNVFLGLNYKCLFGFIYPVHTPYRYGNNL